MIALTLLLVLAPQQPEAKALPKIQIGPHTFHRRELANGLRAIAVRDKGEKVSVFMVIRAGKRQETPATTGLAHLTEHAMYAGTATRKLGQHDRMIHAMGGESNAFTREDYTLFYDHKVPKKALAQVLAMEADRLRGLTFDKRSVLYERERLRREEARTWTPTDRRRELLESHAFSRHNYGAGVLDEKGHTKAPTLGIATVKKFYDDYYQPRRTAVVVVGDVEPAAALDAIAAAFGKLAPGAERPDPVSEPEPTRAREATVKVDLSRSRCHFTWLGPAMGHADRPALTVLARVLARRTSADQSPIEARMGDRVDQDLFNLAATGKDAEATLNKLVKEVRATRLPAAEVAQVTKLLADEYTTLPLRARPYFSLGGTFGVFDVLGHADTLAAYHEAMLAVTPERLREVAKKYLTPERRFTMRFVSTGVAVKELPHDPKALSRAAEEAKAAGDLDRAISAYTRLLAMGPRKMWQVIYLTERGQVYRQQKDYDGAIRDFEQALRVMEYPAVRKLLQEVRELRRGVKKGTKPGAK